MTDLNRTQRARLVPVDEDEVIADYQAGVTTSAIKRHHRISTSRLYSILTKHGVPRRRVSRPRIPVEVADGVAADYLAGYTVAVIAARHGVSTSTVSNVAKQRKLGLRNPLHSRDELIDAAVRRLLGEDVTRAEYQALAAARLNAPLPGLAWIERLPLDIRRDVARRIIEVLDERYPADS